MNQKTKILDLAERMGIIRAKDLEAAGISRNYLYSMEKDGLLLRKSMGLYSLPEVPATEHSTLMEVAKRIPHGIVCLVSALSFYEITTQIPHEIWLTVPRGSWRPKISYPPVNLTYVSGNAYSFGIKEYEINGVVLKIYSPAKTVADCFKFRSKVGIDVAIEALREVWRSRTVTMDELVEASRINRVSKIIRPYLEAIV